MDVGFVRPVLNGEPLTHRAHRKWAESVDASYVDYSLNRSFPSSNGIPGDFVSLVQNVGINEEHSVYILEAPSALYLLPIIRKKFPDSHVLFLHTSWRLYGLEAYNSEKWSTYERPVFSVDRFLDSRILRLLLRKYCDGIITVSKLFKKHLENRFRVDCPIEIIHPSVDCEMRQKLLNVSPELKTGDIVFLGKNRMHKGVDLLANSFDSWNKDRYIKIAGERQTKEYGKEYIKSRGYVDSVPEFFSTAALLVHPARVDAYPLSTMEGMLASVPTIVTTNTGTKSVVNSVDSSFTVKPTKDSIRNAINEYLSKSYRKKKKLSTRFRTAARESSDSVSFSEVLRLVISKST